MFNIKTKSRLRRGAPALVLLLLCARSAGAQTGTQSAVPELPKGPSSCLDTLSTGHLPRVPVYLTAQLSDSAPREVGSSADLLAESVAQRLREILGTHPDSLPVGEPRITWLGLSDLKLAVRKGAPLVVDTGWIRTSSTAFDSIEHAGTRLIARALQDVRDQQGEPFFLWPDSSTVDSVLVTLTFRRASVDRRGIISPYSWKEGRVAFLVFAVHVPWEAQAVAAEGNPSPGYPEDAKHAGREGAVLVQFVIDTTGRADPETIKELWPKRLPRLTGVNEMYYRSFVTAVVTAIPRMRFLPAEIGGCKVRVLVQQPFEFSIRH
jgi:hypothetical protein